MVYKTVLLWFVEAMSSKSDGFVNSDTTTKTFAINTSIKLNGERDHTKITDNNSADSGAAHLATFGQQQPKILQHSAKKSPIKHLPLVSNLNTSCSIMQPQQHPPPSQLTQMPPPKMSNTRYFDFSIFINNFQNHNVYIFFVI